MFVLGMDIGDLPLTLTPFQYHPLLEKSGSLSRLR
mgnify:CR=1 FL=1